MSVREVTTRFIKDAAVTGAKVASDTLTNANINSAAAIVYSKLSLTGGITNADINASAAIAYSKLALTGTIVVADVAAAAKATAATADTFVLRDANGRAQFATPSASADAATKGYVDSVATGLDVKASVRAVTAAALPAYTRTANVITADANGALAAVDGVTLIASDRLLLKNGADGSDNGIYTVTTVGDGGTAFVLTRATDADTSGEVTAGMFTFSEEGTANADTGWVLSTNNPITLNTTALAFSQFSAAGVITASGVLTKTGNDITHNTSGVGAGTYTSVTVNTYGHVTAGTNPTVYTSRKYSGTATAAQTVITVGLTNLITDSTLVIVEGVVMDEAAGDYSVVHSTGVITLSTGMTLSERFFVYYMA